MKAIDIIALVLVIAGGINWGLVGVFDYNLVEAIFGAFPTLVNVIYALVGVAALWTISLAVRRASEKPMVITPPRRFGREEAEKQRERETVPPSEPSAKR